MKCFSICFVACTLYYSANCQNVINAQDTSRQFTIANGQKYLNFPVSESAKTKRARILVDGKLIDHLTIKLATDKPDYWVYFDAAPYQGQTITVEVSSQEPPSFASGGAQPVVQIEPEKLKAALQMITPGNTFPGQDSLYKETKRPQVHFTSRRGWLNDPNGLLYYNGEYHLYYQHNPYGWAWGNMHWGHAVSTDLLHWQELSDAIYPANTRDAAFSGSAVVDVNNTAGFRKNGIDPLIAFYTSTGRGECMKISYDNGRTFIDYEGNPVVKHTGRDPKVFWYEPGKHWVLVLYDAGNKRKMDLDQETVINQNVIYTSPDLKNWTFQSGIAGFFECPELFQLPVEGEDGKSKWVMYDASGRYIVGDFDGKKFIIDQNLKKYDYGGYFYASQTYNNTPDKRRIQIGWGRNITFPGMPFNQTMLFPTELKLKKAFDGLRLCPTPIKEIISLHQKPQIFENKIIKANAGLSVPVEGDAIHLIAEFEKGDAIPFGLNILGYEIEYNDLIGQFTTNLKNTRITYDYVKPDTYNFKIEAIVDKNIIEIFVNDGEIYYVAPFDAEKTGKVEAYIKGRGGDRKVIIKKMEVYQLKSIWNKE